MTNPSKDTLFMMLVFVIGALLNYAYNISMGWLLPPDQYGILGVAISFLTILSLFTSAAFPLTVAKFLSEHDDECIKHRILKSSLLTNLGIAITVSLIFYSLFAAGIIKLESKYNPFVILIIIALIFSSAGGIYGSA
ncbi:MAG TPA: oligosaccharide flippase family protein, partial [Candidatus Methylomirabilis sp.]|nr:oligosaccharide flippase family protein [Candidatus Methylomirabilis sp.]